LKADPGNPILAGFKVKALMGLGRYEEAISLAVREAVKHPEWPVLRLLAGDCAFQLGNPALALGQWSLLYGRPDMAWKSDAYQRSVEALLASGKRAQARALLREAEAMPNCGPAGLLALELDLTRSGPKGSRLLDRLARLDPRHRARYGALKRLYEAVGQASLFEEKGPPQSTAVIRLKRRRMQLAGGELGHARGLAFGGNVYQYTMTAGPSRSVSDVYSALSVPAEVGIAGRRWFLVDSGTSAVFITRRLADRLGLQPVAPVVYANPAFGWARHTWWVLIRKLRVGDIEFGNVPAVVIESDSGFHKEADGILPISLFRRHGVVLDQAARKLTVVPPRTPCERALGSGAFRLPSLWFGGEPYVRIGVQNGAPRFFLLDTGANGSLLGKKFLGLLGLSVDRTKSGSEVAGVVGRTYPDLVKNVSLAVGGRRWRIPECYAVELEQNWPVQYCGIIGRNILRHYRIYFDYTGGTVAVQPVPKRR
jgi:predicted aspartyl protease